MKTMRAFRAVIGSTMFLLATAPNTAAAIPREDKLECQALGGERFELRSRYKLDVLGLIVPHGQSEPERDDWRVVRYENADGTRATQALEETSVPFSGKADWMLEVACSKVAVVAGVPIVPWGLFEGGCWLPVNNQAVDGPFGSNERLNPWDKPTPPRTPRQAQHRQKILEEGFTYAHEFRVMAQADRWVAELELKRPSQEGKQPGWDSPIDAVLQSISTDRGVTWSEARVTLEANIFELGYRLRDSCRTARPSRLNGQRIEVRFPERCLHGR
jgi:hypothetical protein